LAVLIDVKNRFDINAPGWKERLYLFPFFLNDHQSQTAVVLDIPWPGNQLEPHPPFLEQGFGVHGLMGGVEQENEVGFGQGHAALGGWRGGHPASL